MCHVLMLMLSFTKAGSTNLLGSAAALSLALSVTLARPAEAEWSLPPDAEVAGFLFLEVLLVLS